MIARRSFGRHPDKVSIVGLGGYHLGEARTVTEAVRIVHAGIDAGINFLDNAWEYHEGESERRMGRAIADRRDAVFLMTKVCTHGRDASVAMRQLEQSLRRLRTDYLDLWQIHECVYYNDPEHHFSKGGAIEALTRAKEQGKVRYVGFTGHKDPSIHLRMLSFGFPFDACQLPLNGFDARFRSFQALVLPELARQQIAAIGMKSLGGDGRAIRKRAARVEDALRYAMSLSGVHDGLWHRVDAHPSSAPANRATVLADERARAAPIRSQPCRRGAGWTVRAVQDQRRARRRGWPPATRVPVSGGVAL